MGSPSRHRVAVRRARPGDYRNEVAHTPPDRPPVCGWRRSSRPDAYPSRETRRAHGHEILVIGAGPAGLASAKTLGDAGHRVDGHRQGRSRRRVVAVALRAAASAHGEVALAPCPASTSPRTCRTYVPRQGVVDYLHDYAERAGIAPHFGAEAKTVVPLEGGGWRHVDGRRPHLRRARRRRHDRCQQHPVRAEDRRRRRLRRPHPAQPRVPQRPGLRRPARARRRHGQHRRRDRARPGRARRAGRALGALAGQHRPSRRPRPADAEDLDGAGAIAAPLGDRLASWFAISPSATSAATASSARRSRRCASCASTARRR